MEKYKAKIRIPLDQFAFIEIEAKEDLENIKEIYDFSKRICQNHEGLGDKEWRNVLDKYLITNTMESNEYEQLSPRQKDIIQELKRAFKRINYNKND